MPIKQSEMVIPDGLIEAVRSFPAEREVEHCGIRFTVPALNIYVRCPRCAAEIKVRSFAGADEIEDIFDAVLLWLKEPKAQEAARQRQTTLDDGEDQ
jgi:hypothetical protein